MIVNTKDHITKAMRQLSNEEYYKKVEKDLTPDHEQLINQCIDELISTGDLERGTGELLKPTNSRTPIFYMLPKIHKPNNPGRLVVSSVNSHTEKLSAYVDVFLRPLAEKPPSHHRFYQKIEKTRKSTRKQYFSYTRCLQSIYKYRHR